MGNLALVIISIRSGKTVLLFASLLSSRRSFLNLCIWSCSEDFTKAKNLPLTMELDNSAKGKLRICNGSLDNSTAH